MTSDIFEVMWQVLRADIDLMESRIKTLERAHDFTQQAAAVEVFTFAAKPTDNQAGRVIFISDALKDGETTGNGTGTLCYNDGTAWRRVADDTTVVD